MPFRSSRYYSAEPNPYANRIAFLEKKVPGRPRPLICYTITAPKTASQKKVRQPWLTLVLGSGCASPTMQAETLLKAAAGLKPTKQGKDSKLVEGLTATEIARDFAKNLVSDRVPVITKRSVAAASRPAADAAPSWVADMVVAAALLTKAYFRIKANSSEPLRRPGHMDGAVLNKDSLWWDVIETEYLKPCRDLLISLWKGAENEAYRRFAKEIATVLKAIAERTESKGSGEVNIEDSDVRALTELTWLSLGRAAGVNVYPGWSDLLLALSVEPQGRNRRAHRPEDGGPVGTPLFGDMTIAQNLIRKRYLDITSKSWESGSGARIYSQAAKLLNQQYEFRSRLPETNRPPLVTAFVASFDLELELALLREKKDFTIALPVHLLNNKHNWVHTCWIALRVPASAGDLTGIIKEAASDRWSVLTGAGEGDGYGQMGPIVVRLSGCPLIPLPKLDKDSEFCETLVEWLIILLNEEGLFKNWLNVPNKKEALKAAEHELQSDLELKHAVVISEHDALLQSAIDLISVPTAAKAHPGNPQGLARYGLPTAFAADATNYARFWLMLGVQMGDRAVRHRVANLVSALPLTDLSELPPPAGNGSPPSGALGTGTSKDASDGDAAKDVDGGDALREARGVAVNRQLTDLEQYLLWWNGFDVVNAEVDEFFEDLEHYTAHFSERRKPPDELFAREGTCNVGAEP